MDTAVPQRSVLLVDDEQYLLMALMRSMRRFPHWKAYSAASGPLALQLLATQQVDAVVSDMRMPAMFGSELLDKIGQLYPAMIRVMLTGSTSGEIVISGYHIVYKPCKAEVLVKILDDAYEARGRAPSPGSP